MATTVDRRKYRCEVVRPESEHTVLGVRGRRMNLVRHCSDEPNQRIRNQKWVSLSRVIRGSGGETLRVKIRHDDELLNGHASFSITGDIHDKRGECVGGGCCHDLIAQVFPELEPLIQWHLCSTDGPMHYPGNVTYHAGDRDCYGLREGDLQYWDEVPAYNEEHHKNMSRTVLHGRGIPAQYDFQEKHRRPDIGQEHVPDAPREWLPVSDIDPEATLAEFEMEQMVPLCRIGEGKKREFDSARSCAIWPEATDEQLSLPKEELEALLMSRLPDLLARFRTAVEAIGFEFE